MRRPLLWAVLLVALVAALAFGAATRDAGAQAAPAAAEATDCDGEEAGAGEAEPAECEADEEECDEEEAEPEDPDAEPAEEEECEEGGPAAPEDWMLTQRIFPGETIEPGAYANALEDALALQSFTADQYPGLLNSQWSLVGPTNIGGRIVDVAVDPTLSNTVYSAAATGGIWRSTNSGGTYSSIWPDDNTQSMGALAMASDGTMYAGTGELNPGGGSLTFGGTGVYRSRDRGATWQPIGLEHSGTTGRIAVDPTNPNRVFVAAGGSLFNPGGDRGIYRSTDGGDTWAQVLAPPTPFSGAADLQIDPSNPNRIFMTFWDHRREPGLRTYGGTGSGVYRSLDGGTTWTRLSNVVGTGSNDLQVSANLGRIAVSVAPSNPNRVYVYAMMTNGRPLGLYISQNGGDSFTKVTNTTLNNSQSTFGWWFGRLWVDPLNADRVFAAGVNLVLSTNGGTTWANTGTSVHADQHAMAWDSKVLNRVYLGNDGGSYRSDTNGTTYTKATFEPYSQLYTVDVSQLDSARVVAGLQDNGCNRSWNSAGVVNPSGAGWGSYAGCGDGLMTLIDYNNQNNVYGCSQYGSCSRSTNAGNSSSGFGSYSSPSGRRNWLTPVVFDPSNPAIMYIAGNLVHRSTNSAQTFTTISPDLTLGIDVDPDYPFATVTTLAVAKTAPGTIYAGTDDGLLWKTVNTGGAWTRFTDPSLPQRWVTRVAIDPNNSQVAYATFSGFRNGEDNTHVMRTANGGTTWTDISGNLPPAPVNDVVVHPSGSPIYVATDVGVFVAKPGQKWYQLGSGVPRAPIMDLAYHVSSNTMFAATFGRGAYKLSLARETDPPVTTATISPGAVNGWYSHPTVTLTADDGPGAGVDYTEYSLDGGPFVTYTGPFDSIADGGHVLAYHSVDLADNAEGVKTLAFQVDSTPPSVSLTSPAAGGDYLLGSVQLASFSCSDATSGVASCDGTVPSGSAFDTSSVGFKTFAVAASDVAGNTASATRTYNVHWPFGGFRSPIDPDKLNVGQAGSAIPVKFDLGGDRGLGIMFAGYPKSQPVACDTSLPTDPIEETVTAGSSSLAYAGSHYQYVWKTDKSWAGTCRELVVKLADNTVHIASFRFK